MSTPRTQRGVALLTAVLVVALAGTLIALILDQGNVALARTRNLARAEQADALGLGLEAWVRAILLRDLSQSNVDSNSDAWAQPLPPTPVPGGRIYGVMRDLNGCFNLNGLADANGPVAVQVRRLERLLRAVELDPALAAAIVDWVDRDFDADVRGAEDQAYLLARPAYRAANRAMAHASELRLVRGIDAQAYARLAPHVCAVPAPSALNVNTASVPVLMSLDDRITRAVAERLYGEGHASHQSVFAFQQQLDQLGMGDADLAEISTASTYFLARAEIELDGVPMRRSMLIERRPGVFRVIARARGDL